jgi:hypothetical protein
LTSRVLGRTPAILLAALAVAAPLAPAASVDPFADAAANVVCPAAPAGWFNPGGDGGRFVLTPLTPGGDDGLYGGSDIEVDCGYFTNAGKHLTVVVRWALPQDVNPFADFDIGCTLNDFAAGVPTGAYGWNTTDRVYRVVSDQRWSYATFYDYLGQLAPADVGGFESIARTMLHASEPDAHECGIANLGRPVALRSNWAFGFDVTATANGGRTHATGEGTFAIRADPEGGAGTLLDLRAQALAVTVTAKGARPRTVRLRVLAPRDFRSSYGATFHARVAVTGSTLPACRVGAAGTLTVSTATDDVRLDVCGRRLVDAGGRITLQNV